MFLRQPIIANDYFTIITIIGPTINRSDASPKSTLKAISGLGMDGIRVGGVRYRAPLTVLTRISISSNMMGPVNYDLKPFLKYQGWLETGSKLKPEQQQL